MNRAAQGVVLLLVGGAVLRTGVTDLYLRYVREGLRPFLIVSGLVLIAMAVAALVPEFRRGEETAERVPSGPVTDPAGGRADEGAARESGGRTGEVDPVAGPAVESVTDGGVGRWLGRQWARAVFDRLPELDVPGGHAHHGPGVAWLLVLPALALLLLAPPALGSDAAGRSGTALGTAESSDFPPLPKDDPAKIAVLDYASRAVFERGASLGKRRVELTGFVLVGTDGRRYLARMIIACCAADARPIKVALAGDVPRFPEDAWIRVVGRYSKRVLKDPAYGETVPFLDVESVNRIPAPKSPYG